MKLTIQQLANLCMHSWEIEREVGFHNTPVDFKKLIADFPVKELALFLENLNLLFRTVREIGACEIELKADGHHSLWAPLCRTQTAKVIGAKEYIAPDSDVA
jgi:hypothetical protein